jgi:hypothetical protein
LGVAERNRSSDEARAPAAWAGRRIGLISQHALSGG